MRRAALLLTIVIFVTGVFLAFSKPDLSTTHDVIQSTLPIKPRAVEKIPATPSSRNAANQIVVKPIQPSEVAAHWQDPEWNADPELIEKRDEEEREVHALQHVKLSTPQEKSGEAEQN